MKIFDYINNKEIKEVFSTGTAATISPVGLIEYRGANYHISYTIGPLAQRLYDTRNDIKTKSNSIHREWVYIVK